MSIDYCCYGMYADVGHSADCPQANPPTPHPEQAQVEAMREQAHDAARQAVSDAMSAGHPLGGLSAMNVAEQSAAEMRAAIDALALATLTPRAPQSEAAEPVKPLDDPRLQEMFSAAIDGALTLGFQGVSPAPAGHWLEFWWKKGRAVAEVAEPVPAPVQPVAPSYYEGMRLTLIVQLHELIDVAERYARHMHKRGDAEERDLIQGAIDYARKVSDPYNYNGLTPPVESAERDAACWRFFKTRPAGWVRGYIDIDGDDQIPVWDGVTLAALSADREKQP